uniref:SH3 domain-containing protein n=1 Tax=uncultured Thiotrichaceae bacterium TaxID=298394 RepID=A0A6S6U4Z1_9GAMM|nr:MAG: SH3 domain-containing protein [uncultured Thiotrichaceae bacterium]
MKIATYVRSALATSTLLLAVASLPATAVADTTFYQVNNVQSDDALNIRSGAGATYPIIGTIPHNGRTVMSTGQTQQNGRSTWAEVVWLGQIGWVNSRFLSDSMQAPQQQVNTTPAQNNANAHTHPSNRCTRSITHVHPSRSSSHKHHYSCDPNSNNAPAVKSNYQANVPADPNSHAHPSNECTNSVTHTHPNGAGSHQHHYSCKKSASQSAATPKYNPQPKYSYTNDYYAIQ